MIEAIEEYYEVEEELEAELEAELNNVIELPQVVNKLKITTFLDPQKEWTDKQGNPRKGIFGQLRDPNHCLQILELVLAAYDDYLLADTVKGVMQTELPQKGFNREFALGIINNLQHQTKLAVAQALVFEFVKRYSRKIVFLMDGNEIISVLALIENEKNFSLDLEIALRGTSKQRIRSMLYWNKNREAIFKGFYDLGYRRIYIQSAMGERMIGIIMKGEASEILQSVKMLRTGKFNNKIIPYREYLINLSLKYKK